MTTWNYQSKTRVDNAILAENGVDIILSESGDYILQENITSTWTGSSKNNTSWSSGAKHTTNWASQTKN